MKRVVITGLGSVGPLGVGAELTFQKAISGHTGFVSTSVLGPEFYNKTRSKVVSLVPHGTKEGFFDTNNPLINPKLMAKFIQYAVVATEEALKDAGLIDFESRERIGVTIGNGLGGLDLIENKVLKLAQLGSEAQALASYGPFFIPACLPSLAAGFVSIAFRLKGPNRTVSAACATGLYSIDDGASMIKNGQADMVVAGSTESTICITALAGFDAMTALSRKHNDNPTTASRPYDRDRDGFVLGEGAGILILEDMDHAKARGAKIYAEYLGSGLTSDAYHISSPSGEGAERAMRIAMDTCGLSKDQIGYIGTHATSTPIGDKTEIDSISRIFGKEIPPFSAVKSSIGHLLSGASGVESVMLIKSMEHQILLPTMNVENPDDFVKDLDYVPYKPGEVRKHGFEYAMKNSFGFGGTNACSIFRKL